MKGKIPYLFLLAFAFLAGCDKGKLLENELPDTHISVTSINLSGDDRLRSEVTLHWFGADADGWVTGFELSLDGSNWDLVNVQDSTFNFELLPGSDTTDIDFYVRSIDNDMGVDPTPAYLRIPIKNTSPTAIFDTINTLPDTSFVVSTMFFSVEDLDGADNLDSIYLKLNNGSWYGFSPNVETVTIVPQDPQANGAVTADVYVGTGASKLDAAIEGLMLDDDNTFYLKATDIAGAESDVDTSKVVFVKRKTSDLLVLDAHDGGSSPSPEEVYATALAPTFSNYDVIDLRVGGGVNAPTLWSPTFSFMMDFYEYIFWYGDASATTISLLEDAAGAIGYFLNNDGKILISTSFPSTFDNESVIQDFTPVDSLSTAAGSVRIPTDSLVMPFGGFAMGYDTLQASVFVGRATPFYVKATADTMFTAQLFTTGGWVGPSSVCGRTTNGSGNTNMVFISVELHQLNGRPTALENFFNQVFLNEFNW